MRRPGEHTHNLCIACIEDLRMLRERGEVAMRAKQVITALVDGQGDAKRHGRAWLAHVETLDWMHGKNVPKEPGP